MPTKRQANTVLKVRLDQFLKDFFRGEHFVCSIGERFLRRQKIVAWISP